jgi:hypothetical protein
MSGRIVSELPAAEPLPLWLPIVVILGSLLMAMGAVIAVVHPAMLVSPGDQINEAVHIYAGYLFSRNLALAVMLVVVLSIRAQRALGTLMVLTAFVQLLDAGLDVAEGRWPLVPGVLVFAIVFFRGAAKVQGQPFWKAAVWRDND